MRIEGRSPARVDSTVAYPQSHVFEPSTSRCAKDHDFGGLCAKLAGLSGGAVMTALLRWQNVQGRRLRQEFTVLPLQADGTVATNPNSLVDWLEQPRTVGTRIGTREEAVVLRKRAEAAMDQRLGAVSNGDPHPENRQVINAGWLTPA